MGGWAVHVPELACAHNHGHDMAGASASIVVFGHGLWHGYAVWICADRDVVSGVVPRCIIAFTAAGTGYLKPAWAVGAV